ncbi:MAG: carbohydrate-binding domain-containing protein, partial [Candidatus Bathyarchaeia archaeon]
TAVDDGIRGKSYVAIKGGTISLKVGGDGLKSDDTEIDKGYVFIENGVINIVSTGDAIDAESDVVIEAGTFNLKSGGGSSSTARASAKGLQANVSIIINGGVFTIDSADDAVNSNGNITVNNGVFAISTGDDAFHADASLTINNGTIIITKSYEGLESVIITINGGTIHLVSSDDGINGAGGNDASGVLPGPGVWGRPGQDFFMNTGNCQLNINGGYIYVDSLGDGFDVNGAVTMTGGTVIINGPTSNMNGALDHVSFKITGGFLLAVGSSGMAMAPGTNSTQYSMMVNFNTAKSAGTLVNVQTSTGTVLFTFKPTKQYQSLVFSSPVLAVGTTYEIYYGGSVTGTVNDGLYAGGTYTPGTKYRSFTLSSITTTIY